MSRPRHLARRFVGSLSPAPPAAADEVWAESLLLPGETLLWRSMGNQDRRHAITVARRFEAGAGAWPGRPAMAAALLHDAGKAEAGLGTFARVLATLVPARWARGRFLLYRRHEAIGVDRCRQAGSDPATLALLRGDGSPLLVAALAAADDI